MPSTRKKRIAFIPEGSEEERLLQKYLDLSLFSDVYLFDPPISAGGINNVPAKFHELFSTGVYDGIFPLIDADRDSCHFNEVRTKLKEIVGFDPSQLIIFTNPCTLQIMLAHLGDDIIKTESKRANHPLVQKNWPLIKKPYGAHKYQLDLICDSLTADNYQDMKRRISKLSTNCRQVPSTSLLAFLEHFESDDASWLNGILAKRK